MLDETSATAQTASRMPKRRLLSGSRKARSFRTRFHSSIGSTRSHKNVFCISNARGADFQGLHHKMTRCGWYGILIYWRKKIENLSRYCITILYLYLEIFNSQLVNAHEERLPSRVLSFPLNCCAELLTANPDHRLSCIRAH